MYVNWTMRDSFNLSKKTTKGTGVALKTGWNTSKNLFNTSTSLIDTVTDVVETELFGGNGTSLTGAMDMGMKKLGRGFESVNNGISNTMRRLVKSGVSIKPTGKKGVEFESQNTKLQNRGEGWNFNTKNNNEDNEELALQSKDINKNVSMLKSMIDDKHSMMVRFGKYNVEPTGGSVKNLIGVIPNQDVKQINQIKKQITIKYETKFLQIVDKEKNELKRLQQKSSKLVFGEEGKQLKQKKENLKTLKKEKKKVGNYIINSVDTHTDNILEYILENSETASVGAFVKETKKIIDQRVNGDFEKIKGDLIEL